MRFPSCSWVNLEWRMPRLPVVLCIIELPLTVAMLALVGIADPNLYRTKLWQEGADHGWNSDPIELLYAYANHKPIPAPTPWNQFVTTLNLVVAVLSMFIMLVKSFLYIIHFFPPLVSAVVHAILVALYGFSISQQAASDYSDPKHPSKVPWYLSRSCDTPVNPKLKGFCLQAKSTFAVTIILCSLFFVYFVFSLSCCFRTNSQRGSLGPKLPDVESPSSTFDDKKWDMEMSQYPRAPQSPAPHKPPMTPRTLAFNTLDGKIGPRRHNKDLPLRHHIAMGKELYKGPSWR